MRTIHKDDKGVSPVIGVVILIAITVILTSVVFLFLIGGIGGILQDPQTESSFEIQTEEDTVTVTPITVNDELDNYELRWCGESKTFPAVSGSGTRIEDFPIRCDQIFVVNPTSRQVLWSDIIELDSGRIELNSINIKDSSLNEGDNLEVDANVENINKTSYTFDVILEVDPEQDGTYIEAERREVTLNTNTEDTYTLTYTTQTGDSPSINVRVIAHLEKATGTATLSPSSDDGGGDDGGDDDGDCCNTK